jgi:hypothetical protein
VPFTLREHPAASSSLKVAPSSPSVPDAMRSSPARRATTRARKFAGAHFITDGRRRGEGGAKQSAPRGPNLRGPPCVFRCIGISHSWNWAEGKMTTSRLARVIRTESRGSRNGSRDRPRVRSSIPLLAKELELGICWAFAQFYSALLSRLAIQSDMVFYCLDLS